VTTVEARVENWFIRLSAHVATSTRITVEVDAGPLDLTHTYESSSTHATLTEALSDGLSGSDDALTREHLTVHSLEAPSRDLILPSPIDDEELGGRVAVRALADTRWRLTWDAYAGVIRCLDLETSTGIFVTAGTPEPWEFGAPFRAFLHWKAASRGAAMVHASTVVGANGAALIVGPGGTGKSTTTLVGLSAGLATVGDDYVWVEPDAGGHLVRSVYSTIKTKRHGLTPSAGSRPAGITPDVRRSVEVEDGDKTIHYLADRNQTQFVRSARLASIVLLRDRSISAASPAEALAATVPSTALQLPYDEANTTSLLRELCLATPVIALDRDGDLERLATELVRLAGGPPEITALPAVTVALPVYKRGSHLEDAIDSVLAQSGWRVHIVAVDDGSTDRSYDLLTQLAADEERLTVLHNPINRGVAAARNMALARRRDPLVAMIDQDDCWTADRLDKGWAALSGDLGLGYVLGHQLFERSESELPAWVRERWLDGPQTGHLFGTWLAWRETWESAGPLDEALRAGTDDVDWFARANDAGIRSTMIDDVVLHRKIHDANASHDTRNAEELVSILRQSLARRDKEAGG
jgi:hypothetical protein